MTLLLHLVNPFSAELLLAGAGVLILSLARVTPRAGGSVAPRIAAIAIAIAFYLSWTHRALASPSGPQEWFESSPLTFFAGCLVFLMAAITVLSCHAWSSRNRELSPRINALILWSAVASLLLVRSVEMITLVLSLECLFLSLACLLAVSARGAAAGEATLKFWFLGSFAGIFTLFGTVLLVGRTGTTLLGEMARSAPGGDLLAVFGLVLVFAGIFARLALVPFHGCAQDLAQGAPSHLAGYLLTVPVVAATIVLLRLLDLSGAFDVGRGWSRAMLVLSLATLTLGHLLALVQKDVKRMLGYAAIAQMGYLLIPLLDSGTTGYPATLTYLLAYCLAISGAMAAIAGIEGPSGDRLLLGDLTGWGYRSPWLSITLSISLLSIAGLPATAGFVARSFVVLNALHSGHWVLGVFGATIGILGIVYSLRVIFNLYLKDRATDSAETFLDWPARLAALTAATLTLTLGILPEGLLSFLNRLVATLP